MASREIGKWLIFIVLHSFRDLCLRKLQVGLGMATTLFERDCSQGTSISKISLALLQVCDAPSQPAREGVAGEKGMHASWRDWNCSTAFQAHTLVASIRVIGVNLWMWLEWLVNRSLWTEWMWIVNVCANLWLGWTLESHHHSPPHTNQNSTMCESTTNMWMEGYSLKAFAVNSECTCEWLHSQVNSVNSEHESDCVNFGVLVAKKKKKKQIWTNAQKTAEKTCERREVNGWHQGSYYPAGWTQLLSNSGRLLSRIALVYQWPLMPGWGPICNYCTAKMLCRQSLWIGSQAVLHNCIALLAQRLRTSLPTHSESSTSRSLLCRRSHSSQGSGIRPCRTSPQNTTTATEV